MHPTGRISQYFDMIKQRGLAPTTRRGIRTVISGVLGLATGRDIRTYNRVNSLSRIKGGAVAGAEAFTSGELLDFLMELDSDDVSERADVPDFVRFLFGFSRSPPGFDAGGYGGSAG